jgi:large subunit ribosomal protein L13
LVENMNAETAIVVVDASNLIVGRMATVVAKRLLHGERVVILNSERAVISGKRLSKTQEAKEKLKIGHPRKGPYWPRKPDMYVKRVVRGMLPRQTPKGKEAYKRLRVFIGVPPVYRDISAGTIAEAKAAKLRCPTITVGELTQELGWRPIGKGE